MNVCLRFCFEHGVAHITYAATLETSEFHAAWKFVEQLLSKLTVAIQSPENTAKDFMQSALSLTEKSHFSALREDVCF